MDRLLNAGLPVVLIEVKNLASKIDKETKVKQKEKNIDLKNVLNSIMEYMSKLPQPLAMFGTQERVMVYNLRMIFKGLYIIFNKSTTDFYRSFEKLVSNKEKELGKKAKRTKKDLISLSDSLLKVTLPDKKKRKYLSNKNALEEDLSMRITTKQLCGIQLENNINSSLIEEILTPIIDTEKDSFLFSFLNEKSEIASSFGNDLRMESATDELNMLINKASLPSGAETRLDELVRNAIPEEPVLPQEQIILESIQPVEPVPRLLQSDEQYSDFRQSIAQSVRYIDEISDLPKSRKPKISNATKMNKNIFKQVPLYSYEQLNKHLNVENRYNDLDFHQILSSIPHDENIFLSNQFDVGLKTLDFSFILQEDEDIEDMSDGIIRIREESNISTISGIEFANQLVEPSTISERGLNDPILPGDNIIENNEQPVPSQTTISDMVDNLAQESLVDELLKTKTSQSKETPENIDKIPKKLKKKSKEVPEIITEASNNINKRISINIRRKKFSDDESDSEDSLIIPSSVLEFRQNILNNIEQHWREKDTIKFTDICKKGQSRFVAAKVFSTLIGLHSLSKIVLRQESSDPDYIFICKTQQTSTG